ncbi:MAG: hypothetical protein R8G60_04550 [Roseovarius pacificus]|nr:hypothetical protein [Roseovarius pacificus]
MTQLITPLAMSAAGMRLAGYVIETHMRVAQEFGRAAIGANPFIPKTKTMRAPAKAATPAKLAAPKVDAKLPAPKAEPAVAKHSGTATATKAEPDKPVADTVKRPRQPSPPPAMPAPAAKAETTPGKS